MSAGFAWQDIIGHGQTVDMLKRMLQTGDIQHAMLFTGPEGIGKSSVAAIMAAGILCENRQQGEACGRCRSCQLLARASHPDLYTVYPEGQNIKIDQIRVMQREMAMSPCQSQYRVCIIGTAENMTDQAANSLLKILEEPPAYLVFILTVNQRHRLLDTIVSRCRSFPFHPVSAGVIADTLAARGTQANTALAAARLSAGRVGIAYKLAEPDGFAARDQALSILERLPEASGQVILDIAAGIHERQDKTALELLHCLGVLIRDLLVLKIPQSQQLVFNIDILDRLAALADGWHDEALVRAYGELRQTERALAGNANTRLTCEALLIQLMDLNKGGKPIANRSWRPV